jgi:hypothetical protein
MPRSVARNIHRNSTVLYHAFTPATIRLAHTQRRTLPEFSLEGKVAVGKFLRLTGWNIH